jgi:hypothetical protein
MCYIIKEKMRRMLPIFIVACLHLPIRPFTDRLTIKIQHEKRSLKIMSEYFFVTVACDAGEYIIADNTGGSYYLPAEMLDALPEKNSAVGDILHILSEKALEMTERSGTNCIICHSPVRIEKTGSLLENGKTEEFLVCYTAYGSVLLNHLKTGKDYVIFTSYISEGYRTPAIEWSAVTEGNCVEFLMFENVPVMPAPRKRLSVRFSRKIKKTPAEQSFPNHDYGASKGASMS